MYKIAVMGGRDTVIGFKALGLDTYPVDNAEQAKKTMREISKAESNYAIIYLEENLAEALSTEINRLKDKAVPAVILIPGRDGPLGLGQAAMQAAVERAIGTNILGD
jgi:V/A-type H+-transporting ATPase subunit F